VIGTIEAEDSTQVEFKTISGVSMRIPRGQIKELERLSGEIAAGEYKRFDPNNTRLFFAPTARPLKQGQGYFSAYQIFFPFVAIGALPFTGRWSFTHSRPQRADLLPRSKGHAASSQER
jgi:hypothetical protein